MFTAMDILGLGALSKGESVGWIILTLPVVALSTFLLLVSLFWLAVVQGVAFTGLAGVVFDVGMALHNQGLVSFREPGQVYPWSYVAGYIGGGILLLVLGVWFARLAAGGKGASRFRRYVGIASGLLLGPRQVKSDPLDDERCLVQAIRAGNGILTAADLVRLFGWDLEQARAETTRILVDYGGDVLVTDDGAIVLRFDELLEASAVGTPAAVKPFYELEAPEERLLGCSKGVGWFALFCAVCALAGVLVGVPVGSTMNGPVSMLRPVAIGLYILLLAAFAIRIPLWRRRVRERAMRLRFGDLVRIACTCPSGAAAPAWGLDMSLLMKLDGAVDMDSKTAALVIRFPEFELMNRAADELRKITRRKGHGTVVYDTAVEDGLA